jgi:hypothetical protein
MAPATPVEPPRRASPAAAPVHAAAANEEDEDEEAERARRRTIAERMAKLGGHRFGAPPPVSHPPAAAHQHEEAPETRGEGEAQLEEQEEDEQARKERIRAKLAGMGGMRFGMFPPSAAPPPAAKLAPEEPAPVVVEEEALPPPPSRAPRAPVPSQPAEPEEDAHDVAEEEEEDAPPPLPVGRHPVHPPAQHLDHDEPLSQSVELVEAEDNEDEDAYEEPPPPPPPRSQGPPARATPAPPPPPQRAESQWELPDIQTGGDLGMHQPGEQSPSQWSDDSTAYPPAPPMKPSPSQAAPPQPSMSDMQLNADELAAISERVGTRVFSAATELAEQSKKSIVGDGSYAGFLNAVLAEVPHALPPSGTPLAYGYLVYAQVGGTVQRRVADVLPGDVIALYDAKLKGHKGLQSYSQHVGAQEPCVGVVSDVEAKKFKIRALHANQHVSQHAVESVSYRLEDLKSGQVKVCDPISIVGSADLIQILPDFPCSRTRDVKAPYFGSTADCTILEQLGCVIAHFLIFFLHHAWRTGLVD